MISIRKAMLAFALPAGTAAAAETLDPTPRIAVMSAFEPEIGLLREAMQNPVSHDVHGIKFVTGTLGGQGGCCFSRTSQWSIPQ